MKTGINMFLGRAETAILAGLKVDRPEPGMIGLGLWMARNLSPEVMDDLGQAQELYGEPVCNDWLVGVLTKSGLYTPDGDFVELKAV